MNTNRKAWQQAAPEATHVLPSPGATDLLSDAEATEYLRLRPGTLARWRMERRGPAWSSVGRRVLYLRGDLLAFIAASRVEPLALA